MDNKGCDCVATVPVEVHTGHQHRYGDYRDQKRARSHHHHEDRYHRSHQHHHHRNHLDHVDDHRYSYRNQQQKHDKESKKYCYGCLVLILMMLIALVAVAGLVVGISIWLKQDTVSDPGDERPPVIITTTTTTTRPPTTRTTTRTARPPPTFPPVITEGPEVCLNRRTSPTTCPTDACSQKYRTYDGTCNNLQYPLWGASEVPLARLVPPIYEDGVNEPVGWNSGPREDYGGFAKPSARQVSNEIMSTPNVTHHDRFTELVMTWGQYFDHDVDRTPKQDDLCTEYCEQKAPYCFPSFAPDNDPRLPRGGCIPVTRSFRVCDLKTREQLNAVTSYIDASLVYGSTEDRALALRDFTTGSGHLKEGIIVNAGGKLSKPLMPFVDNMPQDCMKQDKDHTGIPCFFAGDVRANEHVGLAAIHTLWIREHNRIADELNRINPHWNGETLYQEARKVIGALHQIITVEHWLPKIVGSSGMQLFGEYTGYNPSVDASTVNSFATASFRFGHAQISPVVARLDHNFQEASPYGNVFLHEAAFGPYRLVREGSTDPVLRGMFGKAVKNMESDQIMSAEVTENLFKLANTHGFDLSALNTQRGRDHGLPGYNEWRRFCNLPEANSFDDLAGDISNDRVRQQLQDLYGHPDNVDLFVAGLAEDPWMDSLVGPTFTCLIVHQFRSWRSGDRFWYQNPSQFSPQQLQQLQRHSLGRVFCDSGDDIQDVQADVFKRATHPYGYKPCEEIPGIVFNAWRDLGNANQCTYGK